MLKAILKKAEIWRDINELYMSFTDHDESKEDDKFTMKK